MFSRQLQTILIIQNEPEMKLFILFFLVILIPACAMDYSCSSQIKNISSRQVNISIVYNREKLDSLYNYNRESYLIYLKNLNEESGLPYNLDTITLTSNYILPVNKNLRVDHNVGGRGVTPDHSLIKEIKIWSFNKTIVYNYYSLDTAFKEVNSGIWELTIR